MLQLYFKRSKIFLADREGMSLRYYAVPSGPNGSASVPNWVRETLTYKHGIADKSIIDLTPPTDKPTKKELKAEELATTVAGAAGGGKNAALEIEDKPKEAEQADEDEPEPKVPTGIDAGQPTATGKTVTKKSGR